MFCLDRGPAAPSKPPASVECWSGVLGGTAGSKAQPFSPGLAGLLCRGNASRASCREAVYGNLEWSIY